MNDEPRKQEPEIMPPVPDVEPQRSPQEVPQDKDAPQRESPERSGVEQ
jgi:hypothetical protein